MNNEQMFYYLCTKSMSPYFLTREKYQEATQSWLCLGCKTPKPGVKSVDVTLQGFRFPKTPLNFVFGVSIGIIRRELLDELGHKVVERELHIGRVFNEGGDEVVELATFRGQHVLIVRGVDMARYRVCPDCGRHIYFAKPKWYLYPSPLPDVDVFESHSNQLVLSEDAFNRLTPDKWKRRLTIAKLKILEAPLDGFLELQSYE
jgi:rubredoxin